MFMMGSEVKQVLKSLCFSHGWSYAVFWLYDSINPMLLRFEDAYSDEQSVAVVDDMILQRHVLGQGMVGEAALTGNHQWLFSDTLLFQYEHEFQNQFLSGFKTIAIIPVGSSGVVQLGSAQKILESQEMLEQTTRALHEMCLKPDQSVVELDTLFDSLGDCEITVPESLQGLISFDDIFREEDNPPSLLSPEETMMVTTEAPLNPCSLQDGDVTDDFGFDILKSFSLDDLYQLLADSPEEKCLEENSTVIQGNDKDLFDMLGINSGDSSSVSHHEGFGATPPPPLASSTPKFQGLFSELISSSLISSNTISSSLTNVQDNNYDFSGLNQSKKRKLETSSAQSSSFFPQEEVEERSSSVAGNWKKPHEEGGVKKKRAKAGESRKPRPKDRQMIQDRIKELRGMIPNGSKCSIDTLLDLTIRHMVFMQSIAKYADKLKQPYQPKLVKEKERTWALEVNEDDDSVVCPIIVEDLRPQGQMEIEMLCEESGQFLEITDVIKGLGLKILKGVMERRQGQIWSHFIVEAKPQVTRIQVFWSLVQVFHQKRNKKNTDS